MDLAAIRSAMAPLLSGIAGLFTVDNLSNPYFYAYLPAAFVMCRVMTSSLPDLRGSGMGPPRRALSWCRPIWWRSFSAMTRGAF